ncbi:MAG: hypothetical protein ABEK59_11970 [Halobacteria archaeon]
MLYHYENYAPIKVILKSAIKDRKQRFNRYRLKLIPPSSDLPKAEQVVTGEQWIKVPRNGELALELFVSQEPYTVELYHRSRSLKLDTWYWVVPPPYPKYSQQLHYDGEPLDLPYGKLTYLIEVDKDYRITDDGKIDFPNCSECQVSVTYRRAFTLDEITVDSGPFSIEEDDYGSISTNAGRAFPYRRWGWRGWHLY